MTATVISNAAPFGALTNATIADLYTVTEAMSRLQAAVASAASGYDGVPGTEYEDGSNFGVAADPNTPGAKGSDYAYAIDQMATQWNTFWTAAKDYIKQLDNGVASL